MYLQARIDPSWIAGVRFSCLPAVRLETEILYDRVPRLEAIVGVPKYGVLNGVI